MDFFVCSALFSHLVLDSELFVCFCMEGIRQKDLYGGCKRPDSEVSNRSLSDTISLFELGQQCLWQGLLKRVWAALP